ncbi:helix-turn-helix domain-containing protein [Acidithiobacillus thiooxidans]|uniref:Cro/CI family transcriptional regulator n=1 Tax=Acidithiobacillus TaxID=119977 RepID=UPI001145AB86|nr:helix-turn-helix domain-containing protein [Acidithiobacillus albertensis]MBU2811992.1 helix-turn-helix domain-containing protein [Acidithiobacillus thiooxidans]MBU2834277.1 helix-turn-helix domain-containing protein [Acidithiobacillus thiooxidans]
MDKKRRRLPYRHIPIIAEIGGVGAVSRALGITRAAIYQWHTIPPHQVGKLCKAFNRLPHEFRPDLYPQPAPGKITKQATAPKADVFCSIRKTELQALRRLASIALDRYGDD